MAAKKAKSPQTFGIGSKVFYPCRGAGIIRTEKEIEFGGAKKQYFEFELINNRITICTPVENLEMLGVRPVGDADEIKKHIKSLKTTPGIKPKTIDYNLLIEEIKLLDDVGIVENFILIIQHCNYIIKKREKEGRLIPISILKYLKSSVSNIAAELCLAEDIPFEDAVASFNSLAKMDVTIDD